MRCAGTYSGVHHGRNARRYRARVAGERTVSRLEGLALDVRLPSLPSLFDLSSERIPPSGDVEVGLFPVGMRALRDPRNLPGIGPTSSSPLLDG
jgi:hypothetical protein